MQYNAVDFTIKEGLKMIRKGFTMIEIVIVIVVIGILASALMLSVSEMSASADASLIVSNLGAWKRAVLLWYMDNKERIRVDEKRDDDDDRVDLADVTIMDAEKYMNGDFKRVNDTSVEDAKGLRYWLEDFSVDNGTKRIWTVGCEFPNNGSVSKKLAARAKTAELMTRTNNANRVWIRVLEFTVR